LLSKNENATVPKTKKIRTKQSLTTEKAGPKVEGRESTRSSSGELKETEPCHVPYHMLNKFFAKLFPGHVIIKEN